MRLLFVEPHVSVANQLCSIKGSEVSFRIENGLNPGVTYLDGI